MATFFLQIHAADFSLSFTRFVFVFVLCDLEGKEKKAMTSEPELPRLPDEVWAEIFSYLPESTVVRVCTLVCKSWRESTRRAKLPLVSVGDPEILTFPGMRCTTARWPLILGIEYRAVLPLSDISGVAWCTRLRELDLSSSGIVDLRPLHCCPHLCTLNLAFTKVRDLSPLASCLQLRLLSVRCSPVNNVQSLASCTQLASLDLQYTHVADLTALSQCLELRKVDLRGTPVEDITPLWPLQKLQTVDLSLTYVADISPLQGSSGYLVSLNLYRTPVVFIDVLGNCEQLQKVFMQGCDMLRNAAPLANCTQLKKVAPPFLRPILVIECSGYACGCAGVDGSFYLVWLRRWI